MYCRVLRDAFMIPSLDYHTIYVSYVNGNQHVFKKYSNYRAKQTMEPYSVTHTTAKILLSIF